MITREQATKKLFEAAGSGDIKAVRAALDDGADINLIPEGSNGTALFQAAFRGKLSVVVMLLNNGANIEAAGGEDNATALMGAAQEGHLNVVNMLIARGANVHAQSKDGNNALGLATLYGHVAVIKKLLRHGATILVNEEFKSPIHQAAYDGYGECVEALVNSLLEKYHNQPQELISYLQHFNELNTYLTAAKNSAAYRPLLKLVDFILQNTQPPYTELKELLPEASAMTHTGYAYDVIEHLNSLPIATRKTLFNAIDCDKEHPYRIICEEVTNVSLRKNMRKFIEIKESAPEYLVHNLNWAAQVGDVEATIILVLKDALKVNTRYRDETPLEVAAKNGRTAVVEYYLKLSAVTKDNNQLANAAILAAESGHTDVIYAFAKRKISLNLNRNRNDYGKSTPLMAALKNGKTETAFALIECNGFTPAHHPRSYSELYYAVYYQQYDVLNVMIDHMLTWKDDELCDYVTHNWSFYDSFVMAMTSCTPALQPLLRLFEHLSKLNRFKTKPNVEGNIHQLIPSTCLRASQEFKKAMLVRADGKSLDQKIEYYSEILDEHTALGKLARIRRGVAACDETHKDSILYQANQRREEALLIKQKKIEQQELELYRAADRGSLEKIQACTASGVVDINCKCDIDLQYPIIIAAYRGHAAAVKLLHESGADINVSVSSAKKHLNGATALLAAAENGSNDTVNYLLDHGADIECKNIFDATPLTKAAIFGHSETVSLLLSRGANPLITTTNSRTLISLSHTNGHVETLKILINYLIKNYSAFVIYTYLKTDTNKYKWNEIEAPIRNELERLFTLFRNNNISEAEIEAILPEGYSTSIKSEIQSPEQTTVITEVTAPAEQKLEPVKLYTTLPKESAALHPTMQEYIDRAPILREQAEAAKAAEAAIIEQAFNEVFAPSNHPISEELLSIDFSYHNPFEGITDEDVAAAPKADAQQMFKLFGVVPTESSSPEPQPGKEQSAENDFIAQLDALQVPKKPLSLFTPPAKQHAAQTEKKKIAVMEAGAK